mgnify:CR=1 FL=1
MGGCRDDSTNTSIYAEVCVPAFTTETTPIVLDVKNVVDNDYCYDQIRTVCEETNTVVPREICTYNYVKKEETMTATTTQVYKMQKIKIESLRSKQFYLGDL